MSCHRVSSGLSLFIYFFFFNDTATTEIYTLSLHDALPISECPTRPVTFAHRFTRRRKDRMRGRTDHGKYVEEDSETYLRSEEHTSELQSPCNLVCRLLLEKKKK